VKGRHAPRSARKERASGIPDAHVPGRSARGSQPTHVNSSLASENHLLISAEGASESI